MHCCFSGFFVDVLSLHLKIVQIGFLVPKDAQCSKTYAMNTDDIFITKLSLVYVPYRCLNYYAFYLYYEYDILQRNQ